MDVKGFAVVVDKPGGVSRSTEVGDVMEFDVVMLDSADVAAVVGTVVWTRLSEDGEVCSAKADLVVESVASWWVPCCAVAVSASVGGMDGFTEGAAVGGRTG